MPHQPLRSPPMRSRARIGALCGLNHKLHSLRPVDVKFAGAEWCAFFCQLVTET